MTTSGTTEMVKALFARGLFEQSAKFARIAVENEPDHPEHKLTLARVLLEIGEVDEVNRLIASLSSTGERFAADVRFLTKIMNEADSARLLPPEAETPADNVAGKFNMQFQRVFAGHRSGWAATLHSIHHLHNSQGVLFDGFLEHNFGELNFPARRSPEVLDRLREHGLLDRLGNTVEKGTVPYRSPWVGFLHNPPNMPVWVRSRLTPDYSMTQAAWSESLPTCEGLYCLSEYHAAWVRDRVDVPVNVVYHPTEIPDRQFSIECFLKNPEKKVVQIGSWGRRINGIYELPLSRQNPLRYEKIHLIPNVYDTYEDEIDALLKLERDSLGVELAPAKYLENTTRWSHLSNDGYDDLLSENIGFVQLYDASANNAIVECIARGTPILVNRHPAAIEYLGEHYPFFFDSVEEAARMACDESLVAATNAYLQGDAVRDRVSFDNFAAAVESSEIYQALPTAAG